MHLLSLFIGLGAPAQTQVNSDGSVISKVLVEAPVDEVRAALSSPEAIERIAGEDALVSQEREGSCWLVERYQAHPLLSVRFVTRACPSADGMVETLVHSDEMDQFQARWRFTETEGGTAITYQVRTSLKIPAPQGLVRRESVKQCTAMLENMRDRLENPLR
ncbi:MAG: hypothetical protein VX899_17985 [Myxococcota bacterium]|nr:hypothetical protein [Myxococcota bacterium]